MARRSFVLRIVLIISAGVGGVLGAAWFLGGPAGPVVHGRCELPDGLELTPLSGVQIHVYAGERKVDGAIRRKELDDFRFVADEAELGTRVDSVRIDFSAFRLGRLASKTLSVDHTLGRRALDLGLVKLDVVEPLVGGYAVDDRGRPVDRPTVTLERYIPRSDSWLMVESEDGSGDGRFRLGEASEAETLEGRHRVVVRASGHGARVLELQGAEPDLVVELVRDARLVLTAEMFARAGPALQVFVRGEGAHAGRSMGFDDRVEGEARSWFSVEAGEWSYGLRTRGQGTVVAELGRTRLARGQEVELVVPENHGGLAGLETLRVTVLDEQGDAVDDAWLRFPGTGDRGTTLGPSWQTEKGTWQLMRVPDAPLRIEVNADGFHEETIVDPASVVEVRLTRD